MELLDKLLLSCYEIKPIVLMWSFVGIFHIK